MSEESSANGSVAVQSAQESTTGAILVVDDNKIARSVMCRILESVGHNVVAASEGEEALHLLAEGQFKLVLLDLYMPNIDGMEVLKRARKIERFGLSLRTVAGTIRQQLGPHRLTHALARNAIAGTGVPVGPAGA